MPDGKFAKISISLPVELDHYIQMLVDSQEFNSKSAYLANLVKQDLKRQERRLSYASRNKPDYRS